MEHSAIGIQYKLCLCVYIIQHFPTDNNIYSDTNTIPTYSLKLVLIFYYYFYLYPNSSEALGSNI